MSASIIRTRRVSFTSLAIAVLLTVTAPTTLRAQVDTTRRNPRDTATVQGSIYSRPFVGTVSKVSVGGYVEGNTNYFVEDGVSDGFSMELRRFNVFFYSPIATRLRFFSELEFEHGTEEISLETAQLDIQVAPALAARMGIIVLPIGAFNQNHDSPRWEFIDRPLVSTRIIPATLSEVGFGVYGRVQPRGASTLTYDAYLSNGLGDGIITNDEGRTSIPLGKRAEQFEEDNNGSPAMSGRLAWQQRGVGELGLSWYGGYYNSFKAEGVTVDEARRVTIAAIDLSTSIGNLSVRGEAAIARVKLPPSLTEVFAHQQHGAHIDLVLPVVKRRMLGSASATINVALRLEYLDLNVGRFTTTGEEIRDDVAAVVAGLSFRPSASTVLKANYRRQNTRDLLGNPPSKLGGYQVGFATYF